MGAQCQLEVRGAFFLEACLLQVSKLLLLLHLIKVGCLHKHIQHCLVILLRTKSDVFVYLEAWYQYSKPYWHTVVVNSWLVVSNIFYFPFHIWDFHPSHWRTHIFQDGYCTTNQIGMNPYHTWLLWNTGVASRKLRNSKEPSKNDLGIWPATWGFANPGRRLDGRGDFSHGYGKLPIWHAVFESVFTGDVWVEWGRALLRALVFN